MHSSIVAPFLDERGDHDVLRDYSFGDKQSSKEERENKTSISSVPVVDHLREGRSVDNDRVRLVVDSSAASKEVVVAIELEAVGPAEELIVRGPRHELTIIKSI